MEFSYSPQEQKLISHFGYIGIAPYVAPMSLYRIMVEHAFMHDDQSKAAASLRRCVKAMRAITDDELSDTNYIYRDTPEFEALIEL